MTGKKSILSAAIATLAICFNLTATQAKVSAYTYKKGEDSTIDKIVNNNAHTATKIFKDSIKLTELSDHGAEYLISEDDSCTVPMPNTIINGSSEHSPTLKCHEFLKGKGNEWSGIMSFPKFESGVTTMQTISEYVEGFGYTTRSLDMDDDDDSEKYKKCMYATIENVSGGGSGTDTEKYDTSQICANVHPVTKRLYNVKADSRSEDSSRDCDISFDNTSGSAFGNDNVTNEFKLKCGRQGGESTPISFDVGQDEHAILDITWTEFINKWKDGAKSTSSVQVTIMEDDSLVDHDTTYYKGASSRIVENILGTLYALPLSTAEVYNIYNQYLNDDRYVKLKCSESFDFENDKNNEWYQVKVKHDGKIDNTCWAADAHETESMLYTGANKTASSYNPQTGQDSSAGEYYFTRENMHLKDIIKQINSFDLEAMVSDVSDVNNPSTSESAGESTADKAEPTCQNQGGAGSLGWIVCSILDWMKSATVGLYNDVVKPSLNVQPELFTEGGADSGAQKAWSIFRDFANIIFVILTLFVIFSQLTGVGIDNYGIKKILPKLVIAAVLINLSYIICLICVDLSNIVGNGVQELLNNINTTATTTVMDATDVNIGADVGIVAVGVTAAAIGAYAIYSNPALLLTLFIAVLGVFIAVLFIFILLAGRKAAIVLLTVVSPIAFILYMLPNTKKIYDKWFNLWKAMLLVYPICGLLIGGGNFASKLMLTIGNNSEAITAFTAMVVGIVPIFFIPTVIKSAYAALGSIGGTIAGFGGRMRGGATRRLNNSDINRRLQERGQEHRTRVRAGVDRHGNERNLNGFQRFIRGGRRSVARSRAQYVKDQETRSREDSMMGNGFTAALAGAESRVQDDAVKNEEAIIMNDSSLRDDNVALRNGLTTAILNRDSNKIRAYQNILSRKGENGREHVRGAMEDALRSGSVSDDAKRDYASNLINKWGADYKNNNRSTFDYANNVLDGAAATLGANGTKVSSLKQSTLASMDEAELMRTINGASGAELADLQNLAYDSLQNETVRNNMKEGTRRELEVLASNSAKAAAAQQSEAQAQATRQQRDQSINDLNNQLQQIRTQSQSEIAQDMGQYESAIALAGQPTQKIRVQMRRDGKYINADNGQEIDISRYRKI